jgi:hypothetical protein
MGDIELSEFPPYITGKSFGLKTVIVTAKRGKIELGKSYRYRPAEGYIHRLPECR